MGGKWYKSEIEIIVWEISNNEELKMNLMIVFVIQNKPIFQLITKKTYQSDINYTQNEI